MTAYRTPWDTDALAPTTRPAADAEPMPVPVPVREPKRRGRRPAAPNLERGASDVTRASGGDAARAGEGAGEEAAGQHAAGQQVAGQQAGEAASAAWLYHHLTVSGPASAVADFAAAARGSGVIPWWLDAAAVEEDVFNLAASQPPHRRYLSIAGCRILARQFRERLEARGDRAIARVGHSRACPLDLHALLPVPGALLQRGECDLTARTWRLEHWGTERLWQVVERPKPSTGRRRPAGHAVVGYGFFTAGDTPDAAVEQLRSRWPTLRWALTPRPSG